MNESPAISAPARAVLHVDMDAFYAAVEQRDDPNLRGKPILVGGTPEGRGVVATASYEARVFGCRSAMSTAQALRLCPHAIVVRPRFAAYSEASRQVFGILECYTPLVEPLSIDEAFLDVTGSQRLRGPAARIAAEIKQRIRETTALTASIGLAPNKFIAKLASDLRKPDGLVIVPPGDVREFLDPLPVSRLWGAGKATLPRFERLGLRTFADVRRAPPALLTREFGPMGLHFRLLAEGSDDRVVVADRDARSISHETTFPTDIDDVEVLRATLLEQLEHVASRLRRHGRLARCVFLKLRSPDFTTLSRQTTLASASDATDTLWDAAKSLFETWVRERRGPLRLLGVGVAELSGECGRQLDLFAAPLEAQRRSLDRAVDAIRERFGERAIRRGPNAGG